MCDFITQSSTLPFLEEFANSVILGVAKWYLEAHWGLWWKTKYPHMRIGKKPSEKLHFDVWMQLRFTRFSSVFSFLKHFSENLQWDTSERNEAYGDKGNILRWKLERSFLRTFLVMCELISQSNTYVSCSIPLILFWGSWEGLLWIALRPTLIKEISAVQNVKEAFWETSLCSVNSSHRVTA